MKRTWTVIGVRDVARSFKWYQVLLGLRETAPEHDYFGQILDSERFYSAFMSGAHTSTPL